MNISKLLTPAAVFRNILEMKVSDPDFLEIVACSVDAWRKYENGDRKMTEVRAALIESKTSLSKDWLLGKDTRKPVTIFNEPFTKNAFQKHILDMKNLRPLDYVVFPFGHFPEVMAIAQSAAKKDILGVFDIELKKAIERLKKTFGIDIPTFDQACNHMKQHSAAFVAFVSSSGVKDSEAPSIAQEAQKLIKQGTPPTCRKIKTRIEDAKTYFERNPEMKPGASLKAVKGSRDIPGGKEHVAELQAMKPTKKKK